MGSHSHKQFWDGLTFSDYGNPRVQYAVATWVEQVMIIYYQRALLQFDLIMQCSGIEIKLSALSHSSASTY